MWHCHFPPAVLVMGYALAFAPFVQHVSAQEKPDVSTEARAGAKDHSKDEAAIRAGADAFVKAYNAHNAKALSELFLPAGQIVDANDHTINGRDEIVAVFAGVFEEAPKTEIEVNVDSVRFIGTSLAIETGTTSTRYLPDSSPEHGRYNVLHVLRDGKWMMGVVRDLPAEPTHRDHLQTLSWLVGDWIDESREGAVRTSCRWADNGSFLLQEITVNRGGENAMHVSQRIGWDPLSKRFRAWVFDTEGGHGESFWTPTETGWLIKATSVHSDGATGSATNHIEPTGLDRYVFRSVDRIVGNELLPPVEVYVVRQAPAPKK